MAASSSRLIQEARARAGLTQRDLADRAGTSQAVISAYENARREPGFAQLQKVLAAAGFELAASLVAGSTGTGRGRTRPPPQPWRLADSAEDDDRIQENLRLSPAQRLRKMGMRSGVESSPRQ
jgi:transcriptional regulator with XRE-family HTH domain